MKNMNGPKILPFFNANDYSYRALSGKEMKSNGDECYEQTYRLWRDIWSSTFRELEGLETLYSDDLLRQDHVHVLLHRNVPIGLVTTTEMNLRLEPHLAHSYFKDYPQDTLKLLRQEFERVMVVGFLTVHRDWRRTKVGPCVSETLMGLSVRRFRESEAEVMISLSRPDRGTDEICKRYGAVCIRTGHFAHNVPVEIVAFHKKNLLETPIAESADLAERLWRRRGQAVEIPKKKSA